MMEHASSLSRPEGCPAFPSLHRRTCQWGASFARGPKGAGRGHAGCVCVTTSQTSAAVSGSGAGRRRVGPTVVAALPLSAADIALVPLVPEAAPVPVPVPLPAPEKQEVPSVEEGARETSGNFFTDLWAGYNELLAEKPIMVKSATSFFGFMIGDICAQMIMGGDYDPFRTARLTAFGVMMDGPIGHCWYTFLDKNVMPEDPKSTKAIVAKTALDQLIWAPFFSCVFFTFIRTLEGHPEAAISTIQSELVPTIVANYALWPLAHLINFRFVPPQQRILYINFVQILWTSYLSNLANNGHGSMFHH